MTQAWKRFLLIHVPLAAVLLGLICETVALPLSRLPLRRNRIDELALAVLSDPGSPRTVLLGDSIIRNATLRFGLCG